MQIRQHIGNVEINISDARLKKGIRNAQRALNMQVVSDCDPLIPYQNGALQNSVNYPEGITGGVIEWNKPYAHYLYMGEVYGPNIPIYDDEGNLTGYWSPPKKHPTGKEIKYHTPGTVKEWFETAKERHGADWLRLVRETVGKD